MTFGLLWAAGSAEAAAAAAEVPPAGSADIAGNVEAKILVTAPSGPVIKLGCRGKDFPCHTWAEDIHLEERLVSEGHNMERSQA